MLALWQCRLWFFFTISGIVVHNYVDHLVQNYFPSKTPLLLLNPTASIEAFIASFFATIAYFFAVSKWVTKMDWFMATPTTLSFIPFDDSSYKIASGDLFTEQTYNVSIESLFNLTFVAKPVQIHMCVIALFIATIAPFAGFFVSGLKRALRAE